MTATKKLPKRTADENEEFRLSRRQSARERIAKLQLETSKVDILDQQLRDLDERAEKAAAEHQATCQPIQQRISEIEKEVVRLAGTREPVPAELTAERVKLLNQVATANAKLAEEVNITNQLRHPVIAERNHIVVTQARALIDAQWSLTSADLANPKLLCEQHAAECAMKFAKLRSDEAQRQVENIADAAANSDDPAIQRRLARWKYELGAANRAHGEAHAEFTRISKAIKEE